MRSSLFNCAILAVGVSAQSGTTVINTVTGTESTSYLFLPGSPTPIVDTAQKTRKRNGQCSPKLSSATTESPSSTSSLSISTTTTPVTVYPTETVYPCANPINFQGPTYGDARGTSNLTLSNSLHALSTPQGESTEACCNTCLFDIQNCVQAYWYFYEGCVVSVAQDTTSGTGFDVSNSCPNGQFAGLTYDPDTAPAFRSTGNIIGPCGQDYSNF